MRWAELSRSAKNVLEMLEGPNSGRRYTISVKHGERPLFDGRQFVGLTEPIHRALFEEMVSYLRGSEAEFETLEIEADSFSVRMAEWRPKAAPKI